MTRIASGFYYEQVSQYDGIHFVKVGRWWRFTRRWGKPLPEKRALVEQQAKALRYARYPTLAMAISAAKGNRAS